jgi:hypothetical protein
MAGACLRSLCVLLTLTLLGITAAHAQPAAGKGGFKLPAGAVTGKNIMGLNAYVGPGAPPAP